MEGKKITTLWVGKSACLCKSEFPHTFPESGLVKGTEYPRRRMFFGGKYRDVPVGGNHGEGTLYIDYPVMNVRGEFEKNEILRIVCEDFHKNVNYELAQHLGLTQKANETEQLKIQLNVAVTMLKSLAVKLEISNIDELRRKVTLKELDHAKESRKRVAIEFPFLPKGKK